MSHAVAIISEADRALRDLMRSALVEAGYETLDCASFGELDLKLRSRQLRDAKRALLVLADVMSSRSAPALSALAALRAQSRLREPQILLTREFGSTSREAPEALGGCRVAGVLEKPFDFALLQALALDCLDGGAPHGEEPTLTGEDAP